MLRTALTRSLLILVMSCAIACYSGLALDANPLIVLQDTTALALSCLLYTSSITVLENVLFPLQLFSKLSPRERKAHAMALLDRVGLEGAQRKFPAEISGGMMKRVAIARACLLYTAC